MTAHLVEVGTRSIRRLCCGAAAPTDNDAQLGAFESIDDRYGLVERGPIAVAELWRDLFASIDCGTSAAVTVVHPSWWSPRRVAVIDDAAGALLGRAEIRPRTWLLSQAVVSLDDCVVVEITDDFIVTSGAAVTVVARSAVPDDDAEAVVGEIRAMASILNTVVVDAPPAVQGAVTLAKSIAKRLATSRGVVVVVVDDLCLKKVAAQIMSRHRGDAAPVPRRSSPRRRWLAATLAAGMLLGVAAWQRPAHPHPHPQLPSTTVVEGRIALEVPAHWPLRRIVTGPGSARLQVTSAADPEIAVHVTQSRVALAGLEATADFLKSAIDAAPAGIFVDFNPAGQVAGRPAVTYREIRPQHDISWTVWVDKTVRISIGCQSRGGRPELVGQACELAVRSARAME